MATLRRFEAAACATRGGQARSRSLGYVPRPDFPACAASASRDDKSETRAGALRRAALDRAEAKIEAEQQAASALSRARLGSALTEAVERKKRAQSAACEREEKCRKDGIMAVVASSEPARELQRRCCAVQVAQEGAIQVLERELQAEEEFQRQCIAEMASRKASRAATESDVEKLQQKNLSALGLGEELRNQMDSNMVRNMEMLSTERREDQVRVGRAVQHAIADDIEVFNRRRSAKSELRCNIENQLQARVQQRQFDDHRQAELDRKMQHSNARNLELLKEWEHEQKEIRTRRERATAVVSDKIAAQESDNMHRMAIRKTILDEEAFALQRRQEDEQLRKFHHIRMAQVRANEESLHRLAERRTSANREKSEWQKKFAERVAEEDRAAREDQNRHQASALKHRLGLDKTSTDRERFLELECQRRVIDNENHRWQEERRARVIAEERRRLLLEHEQDDLYDPLRAKCRNVPAYSPCAPFATTPLHTEVAVRARA